MLVLVHVLIFIADVAVVSVDVTIAVVVVVDDDVVVAVAVVVALTLMIPSYLCRLSSCLVKGFLIKHSSLCNKFTIKQLSPFFDEPTPINETNEN